MSNRMLAFERVLGTGLMWGALWLVLAMAAQLAPGQVAASASAGRTLERGQQGRIEVVDVLRVTHLT